MSAYSYFNGNVAIDDRSSFTISSHFRRLSFHIKVLMHPISENKRSTSLSLFFIIFFCQFFRKVLLSVVALFSGRVMPIVTLESRANYSPKWADNDLSIILGQLPLSREVWWSDFFKLGLDFWAVLKSVNGPNSIHRSFALLRPKSHAAGAKMNKRIDS